jgi:hypothetical protein
MLGFADRDRAHGCDGIHDDIYVRALCLEDAGGAALILAYDLCFLGREDTDRVKGAVGRLLDLSPQRILLNSSHSHVGPATGTWGYESHQPQDMIYFRLLVAATLEAAVEARGAAREVTLHAGATRCSLPVSRRRPDGKGGVLWAPHEGGTVCDRLPVCLLRDRQERPVCLLFSVSCHPSTIHGWAISAEYPGAAADRLDAHLGATAAMFLQGCGGDAKPGVVGRGRDSWGGGTWEDVAEAGRMVAEEVIGCIEGGLEPVRPALRAASIETRWPLQAVPDRDEFVKTAADPATGDLKRLWAQQQLAILERGLPLTDVVPVGLHGLKLGEGLRLVGLEGEAVAALGLQMLDAWPEGVTFPLGYTDGAQIYLVTSAMLDEGGYEAESYWEYGFPAPLAKGTEDILRRGIEELRRRGID